MMLMLYTQGMKIGWRSSQRPASILHNLTQGGGPEQVVKLLRLAGEDGVSMVDTWMLTNAQGVMALGSSRDLLKPPEMLMIHLRKRI